ncbi:YbgA family protein [Staphylococcus simulans]|uniref:YbgA family protein n=1 Tax=Staphylococcus simulans TaxID=1286 RepID=UPI001F53EA1E|nr:YbgA family protein [Staphylococcus simulans]MDY5060509.1 YbgA family protein [Staphylococcus simulans]
MPLNQHEKEILWREYKYEVMWHSQAHYNQIRAVMKDNVEGEVLQRLIDEALALPPSKGSVINAFDHMWGYFKKEADDAEKARHQTLKADFESGKTTPADLLSFIYTLATKYQSKYILNSSILKKA